jgi:DNA primase
MLCLDADRAGLASSARSARAALAAGMRVKAVRLPAGKDPADIVSEGPEGAKAFTQLVKDAQSIVEFFLTVLSHDAKDDLALLRSVEEIVLPLVVATQSPLEQQRLIDIIARSLASTPEAVRAALPRIETPLARATASHAGPGSSQGNGQGSQQGNGREADQSSSAASPSRFEQREGVRKEVARLASTGVTSVKARRDLILATIATYPGTPLAERLTSAYSQTIGAPPPEGEVDERLLFEAGLVFGETPSAEAADDLIKMFERSVLTEGLHAATIELRRAEAIQDETAIQEAAQRCKELSTRLAGLN